MMFLTYVVGCFLALLLVGAVVDRAEENRRKREERLSRFFGGYWFMR